MQPPRQLEEVSLAPLDQSSTDLLRLEKHTLIEEACTQLMAPRPDSRVPESVHTRQALRTDIGHHLSFLMAAAETGAAKLFLDYIVWFRQVAESRRQDLGLLRESLDVLNRVLSRLITNEPDRLILQQLLEHAVSLLELPTTQLVVPRHRSRMELPRHTEYGQSVIEGDSSHATDIALLEMHAGLPLPDLYVGIIQPAMYQVGYLWQTNRISVAREHRATAISQNVLTRAFNEAEFAPSNNRKAVFACVPGNHHSLGLRMISDTFEVHGWHSEFLGADTPTADLLSFIEEQRPSLIGLSASMPQHIDSLQQVIEHIHVNFSGKRPDILVGGLVLNSLGGMPGKLGADEWIIDAKQLFKDPE